MSNLRPYRRRLSSAELPWGKPSLVNPTVKVVSNDPASRYIQLSDTEDCIIRSTDVLGLVDGSFQQFTDALVTVIGGRNIVWEGARFDIGAGPLTHLTSSVDGTQGTISVSSTEGYPSVGSVRIEGELVRYEGKTPNSFTGCTRNAGFYNGTTPGDYSHPEGATVYIGEWARTPLSFRSPKGEVYVEDFQADGVLCDGIRIRGAAPSVTLQNLRIGVCQSLDTVGMTDGHAEAIQVWLDGPQLLRVSHATLLAGPRGRGIVNEPSGVETGRVDVRDTEIIATDPTIKSLIIDASSTPWEVSNGWFRTAQPRNVAGNASEEVATQWDMDDADSDGPDFVVG